ncbi:MAG: winged helix-turn-helix transcriptional regulator [Spirochaetales bacterium]|nr:winged helix-turn-helix transcriptional regulator [Spirochaetales bacterium]
MTGKKALDQKHTQRLSRLWHQAVHLSNKNSLGVFTDELSGVTTIELSIIHLITEHPDYIMKDILEALDVQASTLTSAVNRLEKRGYLKREIASKDRRSFRLVLTPLGEKAQRNHLASEKVLFTTVLECLDTEEEREVFMSLLEKIIHRYQKQYGGD